MEYDLSEDENGLFDNQTTEKALLSGLISFAILFSIFLYVWVELDTDPMIMAPFLLALAGVPAIVILWILCSDYD